MQVASGALAPLANPFAAATIGILIGVALLRVCRFGVSFFTPEEPEIGMIRALVLNAVAMGVALTLLTLCFVFVRPAFVAFGVALAGGFTFAALYELFRYAGPSKTRYARR